MNLYRIFIRTLEKKQNAATGSLLQRLHAAWSAETMSVILDHFEEGMEKTGWGPHALDDPMALPALIQWMEGCDRLPPPPPPPTSPLPTSAIASRTVAGIIAMAHQFRPYSPDALHRLHQNAQDFEHYLQNPTTMSYGESRSYWG